MYILGPLITECGSCGSADPGLPIDRSSSAPNDSTWISSRDSTACLGELSDHLISLRVKKIKNRAYFVRELHAFDKFEKLESLFVLFVCTFSVRLLLDTCDGL